MADRADILETNFVQQILAQRFAAPKSLTQLSDVAVKPAALIEIFKAQIISRQLDITARDLKSKDRGFYTIGSAGHEGNAAIGFHLPVSDLAFLHYRSGGFFASRLLKDGQDNPIDAVLHSLMASSGDPITAGRHKVFGSKRLNMPPQTSTIASHCPKAVGAAVGLVRAHELNLPSGLRPDSLILCSFGDASLNHASAQAAINSAQWIAHQGYPLPIIFLCEDNGFGISVPTPDDWVYANMAARKEIHYIAVDGLNVLDVLAGIQAAEKIARKKKQPVFLHMKCVRLLGHAGSDVEQQYRSIDDIKKTEADDPLLHTARILIENKLATADDILKWHDDTKQKVTKASGNIIGTPTLKDASAVIQSLLPPCQHRKVPALPSGRKRLQTLDEAAKQLSLKRNLSQHINLALTDLMLQYDNICLFGEDVAQKGGVYRVTADLHRRFGGRRVFDTLLDETTILGTAIGLTHAGFLPIPEIQFLAYLHNAEDQLRGEAATLSFFSNGQFCNPMVIRIPSFAYQKGFGGHFHNDNAIGVLRDIPGIIIACPSNGPDAAKMLRSCVREAYLNGRIAIFLEPIALYMMKDCHEAGDGEWLFDYPAPNESIPLGETGGIAPHDSPDVCIVTYGNGYYLSRQAEKICREQYGVKINVVDLRWLNPLPEESLAMVAQQAKKILIVDECRRSGSPSEALMTWFMENCDKLPIIERLTAQDSFIPLGPAAQHILPTREAIVTKVLAMTTRN
jgi:2-oxoisovalerate dehydrogenase E1 component